MGTIVGDGRPWVGNFTHMKRVGKSLDTKSVNALKPRDRTYRVSDGGGLMLEVRPTGAKVWVCRLTANGKRRDMGLGGYPGVSLANARGAAAEARRQARAGVDPIKERRDVSASRKAEVTARAEAEERTFRSVADACIKAAAPGWKNPRTDPQWRAALASYAYPLLGDMPVSDIDRAAVLKCIKGVWASRPGMARKVLRRIAAVLRFAAAHGWRANDNPADLKTLRHAGLPALKGGRKHPALPWAQTAAFMRALECMPGLAPVALRFTILTCVRSGEARGARWSELSFDGTPTWVIPGDRMKHAKSEDVQPHRVPLSAAAIQTLARAYEIVTGKNAVSGSLPKIAAEQGTRLVFPSTNPLTPLSDMALSSVIRRMNETGSKDVPPPWRDPDGRPAVPHGFRSTFRTWVDDTRPEEDAAAERALAHEERQKVSSRYRRSDLLDRRISLMAAWADQCERPADASPGAPAVLGERIAQQH